jgi:hypothetical protein
MRQLFLALVMLVMPFYGCSRDSRDYAVKILVPTGYRGLLRIRFGSSGEPRRWEGGTLLLRIPDTGVLAVQGENPFLKWGHGLAVVDGAGSEIQCAFRAARVEADAVMFRGVGGTNDGKEYWAVIGTEKQAADAAVALGDHETRKATEFQGALDGRLQQ